MSELPIRDGTLSVDAFLRREVRARVRHEYVAGHVYAMTGTTVRHNKIVMNVASALRTAGGGGPCQTFVNDMMVRVGDDRLYYPDVVVTCVPLDDDAIYLREPCVIVEVTSPSTRATDRREKLVAYREVPTLRAYLIVDHRRRRVEVYGRDNASAWRPVEVVGTGAIAVPCPATSLALDDVYAGVALPVVAERRAAYRA